MRKLPAVMPAIALFLVTAGASLVFGGPMGGPCGKSGGCGNCAQGGQAAQAAPLNQAPAGEADPYRQFVLSTIDLRQAMMNKRFDLQRENLKATPDSAKVASLKADIFQIQTKLGEIRAQSGLADTGKMDGECGKMDGSCFKMGAECGKMNGECGGQPCWRN